MEGTLNMHLGKLDPVLASATNVTGQVYSTLNCRMGSSCDSCKH